MLFRFLFLVCSYLAVAHMQHTSASCFVFYWMWCLRRNGLNNSGYNSNVFLLCLHLLTTCSLCCTISHNNMSIRDTTLDSYLSGILSCTTTILELFVFDNHLYNHLKPLICWENFKNSELPSTRSQCRLAIFDTDHPNLSGSKDHVFQKFIP